MSIQRLGIGICLVAVVAVMAMGNGRTKPVPKEVIKEVAARKAFLTNAQKGDLKLKTVEQLSFAPNGVLLAAESRSAAVVAIETGDLGPMKRLEHNVHYLRQRVARAMGTRNAKDVVIRDMVANPLSGKIYLSVSRQGRNKPSTILTVGSNGKLAKLDLSKMSYARIKLPEGDASKVARITDVEFAGDRVLAAGQCSEAFANKIFSIPLPLKHGSTANIFSARTYHVAHGRWETRAPIQSFIPLTEGKKKYVVGAFSCTPIAKFPLSNVKSGAKIVGTSVVELGSGNQPLDMFTYEKGGKKWLVTNTYRFHYYRNLFGPSKWWGVRVSMDYMSAEKVNEKATRRNTRKKSGPKGIEIMQELFGAVQISKLSNEEMVVLRVVDEGERNLEIVKLP